MVSEEFIGIRNDYVLRKIDRQTTDKVITVCFPPTSCQVNAYILLPKTLHWKRVIFGVFLLVHVCAIASPHP